MKYYIKLIISLLRECYGEKIMNSCDNIFERLRIFLWDNLGKYYYYNSEYRDIYILASFLLLYFRLFLLSQLTFKRYLGDFKSTKYKDIFIDRQIDGWIYI